MTTPVNIACEQGEGRERGKREKLFTSRIYKVIIYVEHACLIDRQSQLWIQKAIDQACDVTCQKLVVG